MVTNSNFNINLGIKISICKNALIVKYLTGCALRKCYLKKQVEESLERVKEDIRLVKSGERIRFSKVVTIASRKNRLC